MCARRLIKGLLAAVPMHMAVATATAEDVHCAGETDCRALTKNEIKLARSVFGDQINYAGVRIINQKPSLMGFFTGASAYDGNITYYNSTLYNGDHAKAWHGGRGLFMHEMTHVWQYHHGRDLRAEGVGNVLTSPFSYAVHYQYKPGQPFGSYKMEQQGRIVQDFITYRDSYDTHQRMGSNNFSGKIMLEAMRRRDCAAYYELYKVLAPVFPVASHPCNKPR